MKKLHSIFKQNKALATILVVIVVLVILGVLSSSYLRKKDDTSNTVRKPGKSLTSEAAKTLSEEFINKFLLSGGSTAKVTEVTTEYGLYKLKVDLTSNVVESYITKDGKLFFPQSLVVDEVQGAGTSTPAAAATTPSVTVTKKSDKPTVELFVMTHCPYGTQIEKGILPVLAALGNKIDFQLKFCSYIMHGEKEITESLLQYCIQKDQPTKLTSYLNCFLLDETQSTACLDKAGIDKTKLNSCISSTDQQYKVWDNYKNKVGYQGTFPGFDVQKADNDKYNVGGSPTLVINGEEIQSGRDSASLLKTICSAFNTAPKECEAVLSSASPSAGFGAGTAPASAGAAGCQ